MKKSKNCSLVDVKDTSLVDKSTRTNSFSASHTSTMQIFNIALLKETKEYAEIIELVNGYKPNIEELYNEMWLHD